ncbi:hypothetical protein CHS0354_002806, partial [Potamilus streckersoni]
MVVTDNVVEPANVWVVTDDVDVFGEAVVAVVSLFASEVVICDEEEEEVDESTSSDVTSPAVPTVDKCDLEVVSVTERNKKKTNEK